MKDGKESSDPVNGILDALLAISCRYISCCERGVFAQAPDASEVITNVPYTVSCAYTYTHSIKQAFVYIAIYKNHVNLGFFEGASLPDPHGVLRGDGKSMRHIQFRSMNEVENPYTNDALKHAISQAIRPGVPLAAKTRVTAPKSRK